MRTGPAAEHNQPGIIWGLNILYEAGLICTNEEVMSSKERQMGRRVGNWKSGIPKYR